MPDHEAHGRAVYDHTNDEPRSGRRRRQVSDWGVGEEIFDHMPGPRFGRERRPSGHPIPRGGADDGRRTIVIEHDGEEVPIEAPSADESFASREEAMRAREEHDTVWAGDEPFADDRPAGDGAPTDGDDPWGDARGAGADPWGSGDDSWGFGDDAPASRGDRSAGAAAGRSVAPGDDPFAAGPDAPTDGIVRGGVEGRRTVKIGGRPPTFYPARRPPRSVSDRLGPRPERIAAWAFALGVLLIVIAIATQ